MPLYSVTTQSCALNDAAKADLAAKLTTMHSELAGERAATASLTVLIRTGRSPEYKRKMLKLLLDLLRQATGAPDDQIAIGIQEVPASQAMEMGQIMPDTAQ